MRANTRVFLVSRVDFESKR